MEDYDAHRSFHYNYLILLYLSVLILRISDIQVIVVEPGLSALA